MSELGSGNIFADLDLENAEELHARALVGSHLVHILAEQQISQRTLAELLGIKQAEISHLMNGHFDRFTTDRLLAFLERLGQGVSA